MLELKLRVFLVMVCSQIRTDQDEYLILLFAKVGAFCLFPFFLSLSLEKGYLVFAYAFFLVDFGFLMLSFLRYPPLFD